MLILVVADCYGGAAGVAISVSFQAVAHCFVVLSQICSYVFINVFSRSND